MTLRFLVLLVLLQVTSDAFIEFEHSRLYDEKDFEGIATVSVSDYCSPGCRVYVSLPQASFGVAQLIFIDAVQGARVSLLEADTMRGNQQKVPYILEEGNTQLNFVNENDNFNSAPLIVWVVREDAPNIDTAEVYDAYGTIRDSKPAGLITIMAAEPFYVTVLTYGPSFPFQAITAGFDALGEEDKCTRVIREEVPVLYEDLDADVRSPIITLDFKSGFTRVMVAAYLSDVDLDLSKTLFVTSPGYIGCAVKESDGRTKTFRSSYYTATTEYDIKTDNLTSIVLSGDINVDPDHAVRIVADDQLPIEWSGINTYPSTSLEVKELRISWTRNEDDLDQYFMIRVEPDRDLRTTTISSDEKTTIVDDDHTEKVETTTVTTRRTMPYRSATPRPSKTSVMTTSTSTTTVNPTTSGVRKELQLVAIRFFVITMLF